MKLVATGTGIEIGGGEFLYGRDGDAPVPFPDTEVPLDFTSQMQPSFFPYIL